MSLSDRYRSKSSVVSPSGSLSPVKRLGGLAGRYADRLDDPNKELDSRIKNATERLHSEGVDPPEAKQHKGVFQRLMDALNYLNNKKNQGLHMLTNGTNVWDTPEHVTGQDLLKQWTGKEDFKGSAAAGFGFDVLTDPLNFLSFGTVGAASKAAQAGAKGLRGRQILKVTKGDGGSEDALTRLLTGSAKEGPSVPPKNFADRLTGVEGENLRKVQMEAEKRADALGHTGDITDIERAIAQEHGWNLEDLYNNVYKETGGLDRANPRKAGVLDDALPIEEAAPKPWLNSPYNKAGQVEEVSVEWLSQIKGNPLRHSPERMAEIEADIAKNGFKEPLMIQIGQQDRRIRLGEGNHRLEIAKRLGYKYVPVRVMRQRTLIDGEELAGEAMSKVPIHDYFPGDVKPSKAFDTVELKPVINSAHEIAADAQKAIPAPVDFARAGPPGSQVPGALLGPGSAGAIDATAQAGNKWFAQLGGHVPFTNIGGYWNIPGSDKVLSALGSGAGKVVGGIGNQLAKIPGAPELGKSVKDLIGRNFKVGYAVPGEVNQLTQRTAELTRMDNKDIVDNMVAIRNGWARDKGYTPGQDDLDIIKALEDPTHLSSLRPDLQEVAGSVRDFFDLHYMKAVDAEVIEDFAANYIPHIFKGKLSEVHDALDVMRRSGVRVKTTTGHAIGRVLDMSLSDILSNPALVKRLQPETDVIKIMATYKASLEKAIRNKDMLTELTSLGPDVIRRSSYQYYDAATGKWIDRQAEIPSGWVKAPVQQLKNHWVPPDVAHHLKDMMEPFVNNHSFKKMLGIYDSILGWWKGMATVPNLGYQMRNQMGNMFNNYLAGVRSLDNYKLAREVQIADDTTMDSFYDIIRMFTEREGDHVAGLPSTYVGPPSPIGASGVPRGGDTDTYLMDRIFNDNRFKARFFEGDGPKVKIKWNGKTQEVNTTGLKFFAKFHGVTGLGYYGGDLGEEILKKLDPVSMGQKLNPLSTNNLVYKGAEKMGQFLEDNARLAHFIAKLGENGGNMAKAAESVKKYLFDYTRLTATEKNVMKRLIPFYAFTRNNLPLQLKELVKQPKYASMMGQFQNFMSNLSEDETDTEMDRGDIPKFISNLYSIRLPFQIGDDSRDVMLGFDTPNRDFNSFSPSEWASMVTPLITVPFEVVANRNLYTRKDLESYEGETVRAPGYLQGIFKVMQASEPDDPEANLFNRFFQWMPGTTVATDKDGNPELRISPLASQFLNQIVFAKNAGKAVDFLTGDSYDPFGVSSMLTGVSAVSSTEAQRDTTSKYRQLQALEDLLRKMKDEGSPVSTLREIEQQDPGYRLKQLLGAR